MTRTRKGALALGAAAAIAVLAAAWLVRPSAEHDAHAQWALLERYCVDCHNALDYTADIAFDRLTPDAITNEPALFEEVIRKLRGRMMPPPGVPTPSPHEYDGLVAWLEGSLDAAAALAPNPGRVMLHRLNRTEYQNAIRDLLALDVDASDLLPKDDESEGFDNIANVLKVSPSFLDQYIAAARLVSRVAVGEPLPKLDSAVFYAPPTLNQNRHVDGMPLGTRGGMLVRHHFPANGEYLVSIGGLARARYVEGMEYEHTLMVVVDGVKQFEGRIGGKDDMAAIDLRQAEAVAEINGRFENIPITVAAGPRDIAVTFVARTLSEQDTVLEPLVPGGGEVGIIEGEPSPLKVQRVEINGPVETRGLSDTPSRQRIFVCRPGSPSDEPACAERIFAELARRAFRRPVSDDDLELPLRFYHAARERGGFEEGIRSGLMMILASPDFLFLTERPPEDAAPGSLYHLDDLALASRLSFFLWSSIPDDELLHLAEAGRLAEPESLARQVRRMLADPRARSLVTNFAFQWLDIRGISGIDPDPVVFPEYDHNLGVSFEKELELFLASVLLEDRNVLELLRADHTFLNERVALHYGVDHVQGDQFRRVTLEDPNRFGLFGKGGVLLATSYPNRTAPVLRGAWILEAITGTPPAPPPPDVEAFPETEEGEQPKTVRERLEVHRESPACNGCHGAMDPLGFALENFDAIGKWRDIDRDAGVPIDASGLLADGTVVDGPAALRKALLERPEMFVQTLTEKLMIFALSRSIEHHDMPAVRQIVKRAAAEDFRFSAILAGIVMSDQFRMARLPDDDEADRVDTHAAAVAGGDAGVL
jgi:mono/diheme cytochrome c family protein